VVQRLDYSPGIGHLRIRDSVLAFRIPLVVGPNSHTVILSGPVDGE